MTHHHQSMSSRKVQKLMGQDWERRRSPRISALDDAWKPNHHHQEMTTRIKRRKFHDLSKLGKQVWKGREGPQNEDHSTHDYVEWRCGRESQMAKENQKHHHHAATNGKPSIMPAKNILELVLDTLQRRDTYEIFAEPVDPDEVEDYYEIIKEPMDFGTMRAKLHEGMYKNLEQFEHDVFLIPENAMHFNSSATIYFRQARAMHELAKRAFDALKMDPDNFVMEYSGTRRRSMRKALSESKDCIKKSGSGVCSSKGTLHYRRTSKKNTAPTESFLTGYGDGRSPSFQIADNHKDCVPLVQMVEGNNIRYKESLMSFVKDLGPIAQRVAARKLLGQQQLKKSGAANSNSNSKAAAFRTFRDFASGDGSFLKMSSSSSNVIDLTGDGIGKESKTEMKTSKQGGETRTWKRSEVRSRRRRRRRNRISPDDDDDDDDDNMRPVILALENSHSTATTFPEFKLRNNNKKSSIAAAQKGGKEDMISHSQFTFDLSFLKARLNQMKLPISKVNNQKPTLELDTHLALGL